MNKEKVVIVSLDEKNEVNEFYQWLRRHKNKIHAISDNEGCGCCVDLFYIIMESDTGKIPSESTTHFETNNLIYGNAKDLLIDELTNETEEFQ